MFSLFITKILCFETMIMWTEIITSESMRSGFERLTSSVISLDFCNKSFKNIHLICKKCIKTEKKKKKTQKTSRQT